MADDHTNKDLTRAHEVIQVSIKKMEELSIIIGLARGSASGVAADNEDKFENLVLTMYSE